MEKLLKRWVPVVIIILLAAFLRLYKIGDYMTFLGDEGRDALIVYNILHGDLTLLGPRSSAADFYYGPIYYYMIAPFLLLANYNPAGPAIFIALLGIATVFLVYKVGKEFFGEGAGIMASLLYAISPLVVAYSRSSWNPNPLPFISLSLLYIVYKAVSRPNKKLFIPAGFLLGIAMQLQYLALFLGAIVVLFIFIGSYIENKKIVLKKLLLEYAFLGIGFVIGFFPFLAFEVIHRFPNTKTIIDFIFVKNPNEVIPGPSLSPFAKLADTFFRLFARLVTMFPPPEQVNVYQNLNMFIWQFTTWILALFSAASIFFLKDRLKKLLFGLWLFLGIGFFLLYKKQIYDYYFGFMFPLPFLLVGNALFWVWERKKALFQTVSFVSFCGLVALNLQGIPFQSPPNRQAAQVKEISDFVLSKTDGKRFNFALLTLGNSDHGYRYFFKLVHRDPVTIENPQMDTLRKSVTDQLLIVCEDPRCQPLGSPLWEVAGFGRAEIIGRWDVSVVTVYKLVHYKKSK